MPEEPRYRINLREKEKQPRSEKFVGRWSSVWEITLGRLFNRKKMYRRDQISQKQLDILRIAKAAGISVEKPISYELGKKGDMLFLSGGKELNPRIFKMQSREKQELFFQRLSTIFYKLHNLEIAHNDPHIGNIVVDNNENVTLIDFKRAKKEKVNWKSAKEIYDYFDGDYLNLTRTIHDLGLTEFNAGHFFSFLISKYPCSDEVKKQLKLIISDLLKAFYESPARFNA